MHLWKHDYSYLEAGDSSPSQDQDNQSTGLRHHHQPLRTQWTKTALATLLSISSILNLVLLYTFSFSQRSLHSAASRPHSPSADISPYAHLPRNIKRPFVVSTAYSGGNETQVDELWDAISTKGGAIALRDGYAREQGLPIARRFPWDDGKGLYYVQGFHLLHCVKQIRNSNREYSTNTPQSIDAGHIAHCFDALRQAVMCEASDLPLPAYDAPRHIGEGQALTCRSWEGLEEWALDEERNACYMGGEESLGIKDVRVFSECPEGSEYGGLVREYLEGKEG